MKISVSSLIGLFFSILVFTSCDKEEQNISPTQIDITSFSEVIESGFTVHWKTNIENLSSLIIEVSINNDFNVIFKEVQVLELDHLSQVVGGLKGATTYYIRLNAKTMDGIEYQSEISEVQTFYKTIPVEFITSDGFKISGSLRFLESFPGKRPGIIFMHELTRSSNSWNNAKVVTQFISQNYACLLFDFRGHGKSDYYPLPVEFSQVEPYIIGASNDLVAALEFMESSEIVLSDKMALIGGSLGGILAIAGSGFEEVKATVALSASQLGIYSIFPDLVMKSIFFVAGEMDVSDYNDFSEQAAIMYQFAEEPKKLKIISGNSNHGTRLLQSYGLNNEIVDWVNLRLNE
jgi:cephalosporin-C deacetylase-like acetyl esterase